MTDDTTKTADVDRERTQRRLRNVRLKLVSARRELETLIRQASLRANPKHARVEIERAERHVQELEVTELELSKSLESEEPTSDKPETVLDQKDSEGDAR